SYIACFSFLPDPALVTNECTAMLASLELLHHQIVSVNHLIIGRFFEQLAHFDGFLAADLLDTCAGIIAQAAGDDCTGGTFDGDEISALEGAFDFDDARGKEAFVFLDDCFDSTVVDDDRADRTGCADPAATAGALAGGGDE